MSDTTDAVDSAVNLGKTVWDIVKDGAAQSGAKSSICNAVPKGSKPGDLAGWKSKTGKWKVKLTNLYGVDTVDIDMEWSFQAFGKLKDKKGVFVNDFCVYAKNCKVLWGYNANINATVQGTPSNVGSHDDPIFSIMLLVTANYGSPLNNFNKTWKLRARGDGKLVGS